MQAQESITHRLWVVLRVGSLDSIEKRALEISEAGDDCFRFAQFSPLRPQSIVDFRLSDVRILNQAIGEEVIIKQTLVPSRNLL